MTNSQAAEPSRIKDYIKEKEKEIDNLKKEFDNLLPRFEIYQRDQTKVQKVKFYQGIKGLITIHEHTYLKLKKNEEYYYLGIPKDQLEIHHHYWQRDHIRRSKEGIKCKLLFNKETSREILRNRNSYKGCNARYMPIGIKTPAFFLIYKDTVMIAVPSDNPVVIEIISQDIADSFKAYFQEFWKMSKKFK